MKGKLLCFIHDVSKQGGHKEGKHMPEKVEASPETGWRDVVKQEGYLLLIVPFIQIDFFRGYGNTGIPGIGRPGCCATLVA